MSNPVSGASAHVSNSSSPSSIRSNHSNTSSRASSLGSTSSSVSATGSKLSRWVNKAKDKVVSIFSSSTSSSVSSRSSISGPSLTGPTSSSTSASSSLVPRQVSSDGSIVIEFPGNSTSATPSTNAPWKTIPDDHLFSISLFLSPEDAANASAVCKAWKQSLDNRAIWKKQHQIQGYAPIHIHPEIEGCLQGSDDSRFIPEILTIIAEYEGEPRPFNYKAVFAVPIPNAITPRSYETHFRNTKVLNPMPRPGIMRRENNKPDPDHPNKTIGQTHIWTYRPGNKLQINDTVTMLTMTILEGLVKNPLKGHPTKFDYITREISQDQRDAPMGEEGWYLMPKTVFEGTRNIPFDRQVEIVRAKGYEIPSGPDVILTALVWHVLTGEYPFGQDPYTFIRTTSLTANGTWRWIVGGFGPSGLGVVSIDFDSDSYGLAGLRKFS